MKHSCRRCECLAWPAGKNLNFANTCACFVFALGNRRHGLPKGGQGRGNSSPRPGDETVGDALRFWQHETQLAQRRQAQHLGVAKRQSRSRPRFPLHRGARQYIYMVDDVLVHRPRGCRARTCHSWQASFPWVRARCSFGMYGAPCLAAPTFRIATFIIRQSSAAARARGWTIEAGRRVRVLGTLHHTWKARRTDVPRP